MRGVNPRDLPGSLPFGLPSDLQLFNRGGRSRFIHLASFLLTS